MNTSHKVHCVERFDENATFRNWFFFFVALFHIDEFHWKSWHWKEYELWAAFMIFGNSFYPYFISLIIRFDVNAAYLLDLIKYCILRSNGIEMKSLWMQMEGTWIACRNNASNEIASDTIVECNMIGIKEKSNPSKRTDS